MAQSRDTDDSKQHEKSKRSTRGKAKASTPEYPLTREEVRTAVLHLIEIAAAFEGRGFALAAQPGKHENVWRHRGYKPPRETETFVDDERFLRRVVKLLENHRTKQRLHQRDAILERVLRLVVDFFREFKRGTLVESDRIERIEAICRALRLKCSEVALAALAPKAPDIKNERGSVEAAKIALGKSVGVGARTLGYVRADPGPLDDVRRAFGRWVTRRQRLAYIKELHNEIEAILAKTDGVLLAFTDLGQLCELTGLVQDRRAEARFIETLENPAMARAFLPKEVLDQAAADTAAALRNAVTAALEAGPDGVAEARLPGALQLVVSIVLDARESGDAETIAHAEQALDATIAEAAQEIMLAEFRKFMAADLREFDRL